MVWADGVLGQVLALVSVPITSLSVRMHQLWLMIIDMSHKVAREGAGCIDLLHIATTHTTNPGSGHHHLRGQPVASVS